jgi:hypothetical protein
MLPIPSDLGDTPASSVCASSLLSEIRSKAGKDDDKQANATLMSSTESRFDDTPCPAHGNTLTVSDASSKILGTSMLPVPSDFGTAGSRCAVEEPDSIVQESVLSSSDISRNLGTSLLPIPSDIGTPMASVSAQDSRLAESRGAGTALASSSSDPCSPYEPPSPHIEGALSSLASCRSDSEPDLAQLLRNGSADSLASLRDILQLCNVARSSTPNGQMMDVLKEALSSIPGSPCPQRKPPLLPEAPEALELAERLRQLPEMWQSTIFQMLRQAEEIQKGVQACEEIPKGVKS